MQFFVSAGLNRDIELASISDMHFAQGLPSATGLQSHLPVEVGIAVNVPQIRECADDRCLPHARSADKYNGVLGGA